MHGSFYDCISHALPAINALQITKELIERVLGPPRYSGNDAAERVSGPGAAAGLVWTSAGGLVQVRLACHDVCTVLCICSIDTVIGCGASAGIAVTRLLIFGLQVCPGTTAIQCVPYSSLDSHARIRSTSSAAA